METPRATHQIIDNESLCRLRRIRRAHALLLVMVGFGIAMLGEHLAALQPLSEAQSSDHPPIVLTGPAGTSPSTAADAAGCARTLGQLRMSCRLSAVAAAAADTGN